MSRVHLPPFEVDKINYHPHPSTGGGTRARARYRREVGAPLQDVYGSGPTQAAAKRELMARLQALRNAHQGGSGLLSHTSTMEEAAQVWLSEVRTSVPAKAERTVKEYERWVSCYIKGTDYGRLQLGAASKVVRGEEHLRAVANGTHKANSRGGGEGAMKSARKVMHGIMQTALRHGAIPYGVKFQQQRRTVPDPRQRIDTERAFTRPELRAIQALADAGTNDLGDLVAFLSVVGCRISEALQGVYWSDLDRDTNTIVIRGTKSKNAVREVELPAWLMARLEARSELHGSHGTIFGTTRYSSKRGQPRDVANVSNAVKKVLNDAGCPWAGTHTFRRTVATLLDDAGVGTGQIATVLGQNPTTTSGYIKRQRVGRAAAQVLSEAF